MANLDSGGGALEQLAEIREARQRLDEQELAAVRSARQAGRSWAEIATMLGITRQSAWERWNELETHPDDVLDAAVSASTASARSSRRGATIKVPELIGMTLAQASNRLRRLGLRGLPVEVDPALQDDLPALIVRAQAPEAGARLAGGSPVRLWLRGTGEGGAGVREPRRPNPRSGADRAMRPLEDAS